MAINPFTAGLSQAVNINHLPTQGIARIEALRDGAASIYGSDAAGGVTFGTGFAGGRGRLFGTVEGLHRDSALLTERDFSRSALNAGLKKRDMHVTRKLSCAYSCCAGPLM
jgi:iron complex outermembrane recepter protein